MLQTNERKGGVCRAKPDHLCLKQSDWLIDGSGSGSGRDYQRPLWVKLVSHWRLFQVNKQLGTLRLDLFTERLNTQLEKFASWKQDPQAFHTDAFLLKWGLRGLHMFSPFALNTRCLAKIQRDSAMAVLVTLILSSQPRYSQILAMLCQNPLILSQSPRLLTGT